MEGLDIADESFWLDRPVLVTGATGLLGGWLVKALLRLDASVVCIVRDWVPQSDVLRDMELDNVVLVRGDVCDQDLVERTLGEYEIATVFHLAAQTLVPIADRNPSSTFESNIAGTWRLLEACRHSPLVRQIIVASSDKAYGTSADLPYCEDTPLQGRHPYDVSKSCADLIAQSYGHTYGLPVLITRCGNLFGGGDLNWNRLVPGTIRAVLRGHPPVIRSDGSPLRDYLYVEDAVEAFVLLTEKLSADHDLVGDAFNISTNQPMAALSVAEKIVCLMGSDLKPEILGEPLNEIPNQYLSAEKLHAATGWAPGTGFEDGIKSTIEWYRRHLPGLDSRD